MVHRCSYWLCRMAGSAGDHGGEQGGRLVRTEREVICPTCEGDGMVLVKDPARREHAEPCPQCYGACVVYCCEGAPVNAEAD